MFEKRTVVRLAWAVVVCMALSGGPAWGQEGAKKGGSVPITFLPPPVENATYSVGIYEAKSGKLVRRLCEAAGEKTFKVGLNGLITSWDGKDDDGKALPPGKYAARGYAVGPLEVEGVAILGNDWAEDDESLRVRNVEAIAGVPEDEGLAAVFNVGPESWVVARFKGKDGSLAWQKPVATPFKTVPTPEGARFGLEAAGTGVVVTYWTGDRTEYRLADGESRALTKVASSFRDGHSSLGRNESVWVIEEGILSQRSLNGDVLRSLVPKDGDPLPTAVTAFEKTERLYVQERRAGWQRIRGLSWIDTKEQNGKPVSTWQTFFERNIRADDPSAGAESAAAKGTAPAVEITLDENPLLPGKHEHINLTGTFDEKGSYLSTSDHLRLRQVSQRAHLQAAKLTQDKTEGGLLFYQSDGAAWDEFSIKGAKKIIGFDAGEFEIDAAGEKPVAENAPAPGL